MGMFKKRRKSKYVVTERTKDDIPYRIPNIYSSAKEKEESSIIISPHYGIGIDESPLELRETETNIKKYESFKKDPDIDKKILEEYSEFNKVPSLKRSELIKEVKVKGTSVEQKLFIKVEDEPPTTKEKEEPILFDYDDKDSEINSDNPLFSDAYNVQGSIGLDESEEKSSENNKETQFEESANNIDNDIYLDDYSVEEYALIHSGHKTPDYSDYRLPPFSLLKDPIKKEEIDISWIDDNINRINNNLQAFKIDGQVVDHTVGPTFTRYSIALGAGVSGSKIESVQSDLQRMLEAQSIRIENPIPGKQYVGVEVPNKIRRNVNLKELLERREFLESTDPTLIPVGLDVEGNCKFTSIETLPHGLVAGTTGSGKSVFLSSVITSLLYKNTPDDVRFFFIDPKKVDLQAYSKIPHLLAPIVTDVKEGITSIKWLYNEMERRFALFRILKVKSLKAFREAIKTKPEFKKLPYIIVIIDEAGDFLMNGGNEAMDQTTKLIQKCRAAGIHIFISTQKPVAKIMSTAIKSNASSRFALRVTSAIDSNIILDTSGAEKLLGNGDMIFQSNGVSQRFQSAFVSDEEIANITNFVEKQAPQDFYFNPVEEEENNKNSIPGLFDELIPDVSRYIIYNNRCSMNQIAREFNIGFNRASDIVNALEYYKIVGPNLGTKPRDILVDESEAEEILKRRIK